MDIRGKNKEGIGWLGGSVVVALVMLLLLPATSNAWGFWGHKRINRIAVFLLPPEMISFYKQNIEFITEHAVDPDKRRYASPDEAPRHYIDLDHYCTYPCDDFPHRWDDAVKKYSEDTLKAYGTVPWRIQQMMYWLTDAFKMKDKNKILFCCLIGPTTSTTIARLSATLFCILLLLLLF